MNQTIIHHPLSLILVSSSFVSLASSADELCERPSAAFVFSFFYPTLWSQSPGPAIAGQDQRGRREP
jgi:hypothetical protein